MDRLEYPRIIEVEIGEAGDDEKVHLEKYACIAIVIHSGSSLHYGHYYSYIYDESTNGNDAKWLLANDSQITETSFDGLIANLDLFKNDTPYVLFFSKCDDSTNDSSHIPIIDKKLLVEAENDNRAFELEKRRLLKTKQNLNNDLNHSMM